MRNISKIDIFTLNLIKGIGQKSLMNLVNSGYPITDLIAMDEDELGSYIKGSGKKNAIDAIHHHYSEQQENAERELDNLKENDIELITFWDNDYPFLYKEIKDPPIFLYCKGNTSLLNYKQSIAIVGTRECSEHGRKIAFNTAKYFAEQKYNIVSGLAIGIDTAGHKGTLEAEGLTTAVLTDIHKIYPEENVQLANKILDTNGLLVAENAPGTFPHRGLLVARDRLQSGLSLAVFPIETDVKGGTMHTVQFAQDQNRLLYCPDLKSVPNYPPNFSKSRGINQLIIEGKAKAFNKSNYNILLDNLKKHELLLWNSTDHKLKIDVVQEQLTLKGT
jgi:DNA processing protein